ncbi:hypothetical protein RRG08_004748 [Elysia crispata]|uniref:Uncharacterized protein n=1 Tax=Elysia crispata TaxID=231223 RepID=A0AAE1AIU7_9GAST|nr:hypothetical protein RRG08_004748 [Elysia crispata]
MTTRHGGVCESSTRPRYQSQVLQGIRYKIKSSCDEKSHTRDCCSTVSRQGASCACETFQISRRFLADIV